MEIEVRQLQFELLKMIKIFHQVCQENHLQYFMLGGTCLGAIRHKGFIPWDDDMDVGMPRNDYDRFCKHAKELLPSNLELRYYKTAANSPFHFAKLINADTTLIEPKYTNYVEGIYIDVFPLDNMAKYNTLNRIRSNYIWLYHAMIMNCCSTERKTGYRKVFQQISKTHNLESLHERLEKMMIVENAKPVNYMCNFLGAWKKKEFIKKDIFGVPILYQFEDTKLYGPCNPDEYLKSLYGDYMQLPPKEKQVCRHDYYYVNMSTPYREFMFNE